MDDVLPPDGANGEWRGDRPLPLNYEAEQGLLAALLEDNMAYDRVAAFLRPKHFADAAHGRIFEAIGKLIERSQQANAVTLKAQFDQDEALADVGGAGYLAKLQASVITVVNTADYGRTIYDLYLRRELIDTAKDALSNAYDHDLDRGAETIIEEAQAGLDTLLGAGDRGGLALLETRIEGALEQIEAAYKGQGIAGVSTGLSTLDSKIGGLKPGKVYILAGRPSMGKTALAENIAMHAARAGKQVAFFSLEMSTEDLIQREISRITKIDSDKINNGRLNEQEMEQVIGAREVLASLPLHVDDASGISVAGMRARARRMKRRGGLDLVVIDYLQLMSDETLWRGANRNDEVSAITRGVKTSIAKDLDVPVLLLSQINRQVEGRDDKRPHLADLRDSGSIEQDGDVVMFLFREIYYLSQNEPRRKPNESSENFAGRCFLYEKQLIDMAGNAEVIIAKQRSGPTGSVTVQFDGPMMLFYDSAALAEDQDQHQPEIPL